MSENQLKSQQDQPSKLKYDPDITPVLEQAADSELDPLVRCLVKAGADDWIEDSLYGQFAPYHSRYAHLIADAIVRKPVVPDPLKLFSMFLRSDDDPDDDLVTVKIPDSMVTSGAYKDIVRMAAYEIELLYRGWNPGCGVMAGHADGRVECQCKWWKDGCIIDQTKHEYNRFSIQCEWWKEKYEKNTYSVEQRELLILLRILQNIMAEKSDSERAAFSYELNIFQSDFDAIDYAVCADVIQAAIRENLLCTAEVNKSISRIYKPYLDKICQRIDCAIGDFWFDGYKEYISTISKLTTPCVAHIAILRQKLSIAPSTRKRKPAKIKANISFPQSLYTVTGSSPADGTTIQVKVEDDSGVAIPGQDIDWAITSPGGRNGAALTADSPSDDSGVATVFVSGKNIRREVTITATLRSDTSKTATTTVRFGEILPLGFLALYDVIETPYMDRGEAKRFCMSQGGCLPKIRIEGAYLSDYGETVHVDGFGSLGGAWPPGLPAKSFWAGYWTDTEAADIPGNFYFIYNDNNTVFASVAPTESLHHIVCVSYDSKTVDELAEEWAKSLEDIVCVPDDSKDNELAEEWAKALEDVVCVPDDSKDNELAKEWKAALEDAENPLLNKISNKQSEEQNKILVTAHRV
jgi:hypothetical protein